jgi:hypothetical protein
VTNLYPNPDLSVNGPYAMCGKCHNLTMVASSASWAQHAMHINAGFTCSTCHTSHGMTPGTGNVTGERMVNFDLKIVAPNGGMPVTYNRGPGTCALMCHDVAHFANGMVTPMAGRSGVQK